MLSQYISFFMLFLIMDIHSVKYWYIWFCVWNEWNRSYHFVGIIFQIVWFNSMNRHTKSFPYRISSSASTSEYLCLIWNFTNLLILKSYIWFTSIERNHHKLPSSVFSLYKINIWTIIFFLYGIAVGVFPFFILSSFCVLLCSSTTLCLWLITLLGVCL